MQYSRDFKAHLASLFLSESVDVGKKYIFDVQRTSKEVYDRARRTLFKSSALSPARQMSTEEEEGSCEGCRGTWALRDKLQSLQEALTCALCCDGEINTTFCPCGHMVCCQICAAQLQVSNLWMLYAVLFRAHAHVILQHFLYAVYINTNTNYHSLFSEGRIKSLVY